MRLEERVLLSSVQVRSVTGPKFREQFAALPSDIQLRAKLAYYQRRENPHHPGLHFGRGHQIEPIESMLGWTSTGRAYPSPKRKELRVEFHPKSD